MTADQQQALTLVGNAGGKLATSAASLSTLTAALDDCVSAGWLASAGGFYLMGAAGEQALAAALEG